MKISASVEIKALFALAETYNERKPPAWPMFASPKLNGVRAMWVPQVGFFSRDGAAYEPGVLPHIEAELSGADLWLDGEFYTHGLHLQEINSRAGVVRKTPHADAAVIQFHAFDIAQTANGFVRRQSQIRDLLMRLNAQHTLAVPYKECSCQTKADAAYDAFLSAGYEGAMYKVPGGYMAGRSRMMLKRKGWKDEDYEVVRLVKGEGKYEASMGAVVLRNARGKEFEVGSFALTDEQRLAVWFGPKPATAKVKYLGLTADGKPFNAQVLAFI